MRKLLLTVATCTAFACLASAQQSLPSIAWHRSATTLQRAYSGNWIGYQHAMTMVSDYQRPYLDAISSLLSQRMSGARIVHRMIEDFPADLNRERAELMLALAQWEGKRSEASRRTLEKITGDGLMIAERNQYLAMRGYMALNGIGGSADVEQARRLLSHASTGEDIWADRATLYLSSLEWSQGNRQKAEAILKERMWNDETLPEVEYQGAMIGFETNKPSTAIAQAQQVIRRYPELATRQPLIGAIGQAYYSMGDYPNAIKTITSLEASALTPNEAYALGASYYHQKDYQRAIAPLQLASESEGMVASLAQYALGNAYHVQDKPREAQLALQAVVQNKQTPSDVREQAMYQLIELGFSGGHDAFGQQLRQAETFLASFPRSRHRERVLELLRSYLVNSQSYDESLTILDRLARQGEAVAPIRQEVLVRYASALSLSDARSTKFLDEAISIGSGRDAYVAALTMRAQRSIAEGKYQLAEQDLTTALAHPYTTSPSGYEHGVGYYLRGYAKYNRSQYASAYTDLQRYSDGTGANAQRADAFVRMGDCLLAQGQAKRAIAHYEDANKLLAPLGNDEALYRIASIYGQQASYAKQIETISRLEREHPQSPFLAQSLYERGRAQAYGLNNLTAAATSFLEVEKRFPASAAASLSALEIAMIHSNAGKEEEAIRAYKHVIERYPETKEAKTALSDLRSLYSERNALDEYASYARTLGGKLAPNAEDKAHLDYLALESRVRRGDATVVSELEDYVRRYPQGADRTSAERLLVAQYERAEDTAKAIDLLKQMLQRKHTTDDELALRRQYAGLLMQRSNQKEATEELSKAYKLSSGSKQTSQEIGLQLAENYLATQRYADGIQLTKDLLTRTDLDEPIKQRIILAKGRNEEGIKATKAAISTYTQLADVPNSPAGAEATVRRADLLLSTGQVNAAQTLLGDFIAKGTNQQYWLARAFVLLSDTYDKQGERYLAKQYIQSLRDNYKGQEADIQQMIDQRLKKYVDNNEN